MNREQADALQSMFNGIAPVRVGVTCTVVRGRRAGQTVVVVRHMKDPYNPGALRYGGDMSLHLREARGQYGYRAQVRNSDGELFWVPGQYLEAAK